MAGTKHESTGDGGLRGRAAAVLERAWRRVRSGAWLIAQRTIAAAIAWAITLKVFDHHDPFFAPISAVVGSNSLGLLSDDLLSPAKAMFILQAAHDNTRGTGIITRVAGRREFGILRGS